MIEKIISFVEALLLHGVLFAVIIFNFELPFLAPLKSIEIPSEKVIEAIAIDEKQLVVAVKQQRLAQAQRTQYLEQEYAYLKQQRREIERSTEREHKQLEKLQRQKAREQKKIETLQQKRWAAATKIEQLQRKKAEKLRLKRKAEARRREENRRTEERKRQEQARRQALAKQKEEKRRAAARERQRKKAQERAARQAGSGKGTHSQKQASSTASTQDRLQQVMKKIQQQVQSHWIRPRGHYQGLSCTIDIFLYRNGSVKRATITKSSGHRIFDNSALRAVHQASPLPIPTDLFEHFRHFRFQFKP